LYHKLHFHNYIGISYEDLYIVCLRLQIAFGVPELRLFILQLLPNCFLGMLKRNMPMTFSLTTSTPCLNDWALLHTNFEMHKEHYSSWDYALPIYYTNYFALNLVNALYYTSESVHIDNPGTWLQHLQYTSVHTPSS